MSTQEIFDKVATHLLVQGRRSAEGDGCRYRASGGLMCAIGCLIADEHYSEDLEHQAARADSVRIALGRSGVLVDADFARALQLAHDGANDESFNDDVCRALTYVARDYNLSPEALA